MISVYKTRIAAAGGKPLGTCLLLLLVFQSLFVLAQTNVRVSGTVTGDTDDSLRSEEHTSELQSLMRFSYAVFCLKKNKNRNDCRQPTIISIQTMYVSQVY